MQHTSALSANSDGPTHRHRVVVVGGGFGGLQAAKHLAAAPVDLTLVDRRNFHLFQPLTYQVATGALSPGEVAYPLRADLQAAPQRARAAWPRSRASTSTGRRRAPRRDGSAALRHADRRRRLALLLLRPRRLGALRARGQVARERARDPCAHPERLRGRRDSSPTPTGAGRCSRSSSSAPARPASRWPARSPSSPATRCAATSAPSTRASPGPAGRGRRPRADQPSRPRCRARPRARSRPSASRRCWSARSSTSTRRPSPSRRPTAPPSGSPRAP